MRHLGGTEHGSTGGMAGSLPDQSSQVCGATMGMDNIKREKQRDRQGREMVSGMTDFFLKLIMWKLISGKKIKIKTCKNKNGHFTECLQFYFGEYNINSTVSDDMTPRNHEAPT